MCVLDKLEIVIKSITEEYALTNTGRWEAIPAPPHITADVLISGQFKPGITAVLNTHASVRHFQLSVFYSWWRWTSSRPTCNRD